MHQPSATEPFRDSVAEASDESANLNLDFPVEK